MTIYRQFVMVKKVVFVTAESKSLPRCSLKTSPVALERPTIMILGDDVCNTAGELCHRLISIHTVSSERICMMYQKVIIVGNLGSSPELRHTPQGDPVKSFGTAVNRRWTNRDGEPGEETTWFQVTVWGSQAEVCCQYLTKGRMVLVEDRLIPDNEQLAKVI
jgi:hypothetical protein